MAALQRAVRMDENLLETALSQKHALLKKEWRRIGDKERLIYMTKGPLRTLLRRLHLRLQKLPVPDEFYGGVRGRSVIQNARRHAGKRCVLNLDLKDFFPSVHRDRIEGVFRQLGCSMRMSRILADVCTDEDQLPQGFATSPLLSVFALIPLAIDLREFLIPRHFTFTFWIDDLTVSGDSNPLPLIPDIQRLCKRYGFSLKRKKIHLGKRGESRQEVTGITINGTHLSPSPGFIEDTHNMIYFMKHYGWEMACSFFSLDCSTEKNFQSCLKGRIRWIQQLIPQKAAKLQREWK